MPELAAGALLPTGLKSLRARAEASTVKDQRGARPNGASARTPVSVVVVAAPHASRTAVAACVASLRPSLGLRDEVLVTGCRVDGARTIDVPPTATLAERRSAAVGAAHHEIVVLVDADVSAPAHAIDPLVASLASCGVVACAPLSGLAPGRQQVCAPLDAVARPAALRSWSRAFHESHRGASVGADDLADTVLAARRDVLRLDSLEPGIAGRLAVHGQLRLLGDSVWHHCGSTACSLVTAPRPLISVTMIVKDEEDVLAECLTAVAGLPAEIVVYDTGSTDRTVEIARAHGARVVLGYWDDDFGAARTRAMQHCTGTWLLWVDADEVLTGDLDSFVRDLASGGESFYLEIESLTETGHGSRFIAPIRRVARRELAWFTSRIHEQLMHREGRHLSTLPMTDSKLVHSGYLANRMESRDKTARNVRLANLAIADGVHAPGQLPGEALSNLVRASTHAGQYDEALRAADRSLTVAHTGLSRRDIAVAAVLSAVALQRPADARLWLERLRAASTRTARGDEMEISVLMAEHRIADAVAVCARLPQSELDDDGRVVSRFSVLRQEVLMHAEVGNHASAAGCVLAAAQQGIFSMPLEEVVTALVRADVAVDDYVRELPSAAVMTTLAEVRRLKPRDADAVLESLWVRDMNRPGVLAAAPGMAMALPVLRALEWSARLRSSGSSQPCPLVALAFDASRSPRDRIVAAAVALEAFGDDSAASAFIEAAGLVSDDTSELVAKEVELLAPMAAGLWLA